MEVSIFSNASDRCDHADSEIVSKSRYILMVDCSTLIREPIFAWLNPVGGTANEGQKPRAI